MAITPKKFWIAVAVVIIAGGGFVVAEFLNRPDTIETKPELKVIADAQLALIEKDTDGDGLKDWEETLWKTDPQTADSDGDGTKDGDEIKAGRDPLTKGPKDKLDKETIEKKINPTTEKDLTETEKFSREFFTRYLASEQTNKPPDPNDYGELIGRYVSENPTTGAPRLYGAADLTVGTNETPSALKTYGNNLATIVLKQPYQKTDLESELLIMDRFGKNNDPKELEKLSPLVAEYKRMEEGLARLPVPRIALILHIELINTVSAIRYGIEAMRFTVTDPIRAIAGIRFYPDAADNFVPALRQFKKYFSEKGVVFAPGEDGYKLFTVL